MSHPGFMLDIPEALLRGGRYLPLTRKIPLPGGVVTMKSSPRDAEVLFGELATRREPFTMVLCRTPSLKADGTLSLHGHGVLGMVTRHEPGEDGDLLTDLMGIGRVALGEPYLLVDEHLPRIDVTRRAPVDDAQPEALQLALEAIINTLCEPLRHLHPELVHMLTHFSTSHGDVGIHIDRVANTIAEGDVALLQSFIDETSLIGRLHLLHDAIQRHIATLNK